MRSPQGEVLNQISAFWFEKLDFIPNHVVTPHFRLFPADLKPFESQLAGRSMIVKKAAPLPVECVARGYLAGSGWNEYREKGSVCGNPLPKGLRQSDRLPETIFTPAIKADSGHDENITWRECRALLGDDIALQVRKWTIDLYEHGRAYAAQRGIIVADTKFEFGVIDDEVILIDECLTPDSSRFWAEDEYSPGEARPFDKQFVRDYLESVSWNKQPPAPSLPAEIVARTSEKYLDAYSRLAGLKLAAT
jgi:phosphoribosylaminoimidazole-succinocarboxamide synthase